MKFFLFVSTLITSIALKSCKTMDISLTLNNPEQLSNVVQQIPADENGRKKNALYLPPREIKTEEFNTPILHAFIDTMYSVMKNKSGVGIAANQLGRRLQIFIIEAKSDNLRYKVLGPVPKQIFINPMITKVSANRKNFWHGCLSANGEKRGNVATYEWIEYTCKDEKGNVQTGRLDGFAAVIFQHEFRHLLNGTYLDVAKQFLSKPELDLGIEKGEIPFFETASDTLPLLIGDYTIGETLDQYHSK